MDIGGHATFSGLMAAWTSQCVGCQARKEGLNWLGGEQGTSESCAVPRGHHHFPKQGDRQAGAWGTASASILQNHMALL